MKSFKQTLHESSLSKIWRYTQDHDTGAITAYRSAVDCEDSDKGVYTKNQNKQRNRSLLAKLKAANYTVISVSGKYPEGGKVVTERSFFVVDADDKGNLKKDLLKWGKEFDQDSILFVEKGTAGKLIGTNSCSNNDLRGGKTMKFDKTKFGKEGEFYSSLIRGRPFFSESIEIKEEIFGSGFSSIVNGKISKQKWQDIEI